MVTSFHSYGNLSMSFQGLSVEKKSNMGVTRKHARLFELIGGHPALDLVNTLDWRFRPRGTEEMLTSYEELLGFMTQSQLLTQAQARRMLHNCSTSEAEHVLAKVRELREAAAEVLYGELDGRKSSGAVRRLEMLFQECRRHQRLRWAESKLRWDFADSYDAEFPLWLLSLATAELLTSDRMQFLRECGNEDCRWLFLDTSKNHTRRWCDMKICGNRMKARRYKAQLRLGGATHSSP